MTKIDLVKDLKHLYSASPKESTLVDVPPLRFLMVDGKGDPNIAPEYKDAIEALYSVAYTIKFAVKKGEAAIDFGVPPLEGLWWTGDMAAFSQDDKGAWSWTMMIMQPDFVTEELVRQAVAQVQRKDERRAVSKVRLEEYREGQSAQILHIGPYAAEGPTIAVLHAYIAAAGYERSGKHHEIYLGDPRRSAPEKLRTIVRQPVAVAGH